MPTYVIPKEIASLDGLKDRFPGADIREHEGYFSVDTPTQQDVPLTPTAQVRANIGGGKYQTNLVYPAPNDLKHGIQKELYLEDVERLQVRFRADALTATGVLDHPKAEQLYDIAVDEAGGDSLMSRFDWIIRLAPLLID